MDYYRKSAESQDPNALYDLGVVLLKVNSNNIVSCLFQYHICGIYIILELIIEHHYNS